MCLRRAVKMGNQSWFFSCRDGDFSCTSFADGLFHGLIDQSNADAIVKSLGSDFIFFGSDLLRFRLLRRNALLSAPAGFLVLRSPGLRLVRQLLGPQSLRLLLVNEFHQDALVLEHVTLGFDVELVIEMSVDLLVFAVFLQQTPQDSHTPHPQLLDGHPSVGCSLALAGAGVTALSAGEG